jgi:hypothetical protein
MLLAFMEEALALAAATAAVIYISRFLSNLPAFYYT